MTKVKESIRTHRPPADREQSEADGASSDQLGISEKPRFCGHLRDSSEWYVIRPVIPEFGFSV
jgi:hypothetical protein